MKPITIKLIYQNKDFNEETIFQWENENLALASNSSNDIANRSINHSILKELYFSEEDTNYLMVEKYIKVHGENIIKLAKETDAEICMMKNYWYDNEPAIEEVRLEKSGYTIFKQNVKTEYYNDILPFIEAQLNIEA